MKTHSTSFRFATLLLTVACSTTTLPAQQATTRTTPPRQTATAKPPPTLAKPAARSTASTLPKPAATGSVARPSSDPQPTPITTQATPSTQSAPVRSATTGKTASLRTANHTAFSTGRPRNKYLNVGVGLAAYYGAGLSLGASFEVDVKNNISAGGSFDYLRYSGGYTFIYVGARGSRITWANCWVRDRKFDPYAGFPPHGLR